VANLLNRSKTYNALGLRSPQNIHRRSPSQVLKKSITEIETDRARDEMESTLPDLALLKSSSSKVMFYDIVILYTFNSIYLLDTGRGRIATNTCALKKKPVVKGAQLSSPISRKPALLNAARPAMSEFTPLYQNAEK